MWTGAPVWLILQPSLGWYGKINHTTLHKCCCDKAHLRFPKPHVVAHNVELLHTSADDTFDKM